MKQLHVFTVFLTPKCFFDGQFRYLAERGDEIVLCCSPEEGIEGFAERNHIRYVPVEIPRSISPMGIVRAIKQIGAIIKRERPDVVFGHTPVAALCAMIASYLCRVKNRIYYRHGVIYTTMKGVKRFIFKMEERFVSALATDIVNVSHSLSKLAVADHLNSDSKQHVIGHGTCGGIDAHGLFYPYKNLEGYRDKNLVFGYAGRLCVDKGTPELVEGFVLFKGRHPEVRAELLLIGELDARDVLPERTKEVITGSEDIHLTGWVERGVMPRYYSMMDVFVFPSHREGFGMCVLEANAMEKPVLVSRSHGCIDSIVEHVTGEYIELSAMAICKGMESMLDAEKRVRLGKAGRKWVLENFDQSVMWPEVSKLYKEILN